MDKKLSFFAIDLILLFVGCDDSTETFDTLEYYQSAQNKVKSYGTGSQAKSYTFNDFEQNQQEEVSVSPQTLYGYTSKTTKYTRSVLATQAMRDALGIPQGIYVMDLVYVYYDFTIEGLSSGTLLFSPANSPQCGFNPDDMSVRGYISSISGNNVKLSSRFTFIKCSSSGAVYNLWYPINPENTIWNYNIINLNN